MTLDELNRLPVPAAIDLFIGCCGSRTWATRMARHRPFADTDALFAAADRTWLELSETDWLAAFAAHPRIGENTTSSTARHEQAGALAADADVKQALAAGNREYEAKFGFIYIVFASGKTAQEMLDLLRARLRNDRKTEIRNAATEQLKITRVRLSKTLERAD